MTTPLAALRTLLREAGATPAPHPLILPALTPSTGELRPADQGAVETQPRPFSFFLTAAAEACLLGEVPQPNGAPLPITLLSLAVGIAVRTDSRLQPFMKPLQGLVIAMPAPLAEAIQVERFRIYGLTPIAAGNPALTRAAMLEDQMRALALLIEDTKESMFLAWHESAGVAGHQILVEGSLQPSSSVLTAGSWTGVRAVSQLTPLEEQAALGLPVRAASVPFGYDLSGGYWFTRLAASSRPDALEGLLRLDTAFVNNEQVASKVSALTRMVIHERFPVVAPAEGQVPLYPLQQTRSWLATQITAGASVMQAL